MQPKKEARVAKLAMPLSWRKVLPGLALVALGVLFGFVYFQDNTNAFMGALAAIFVASGGVLIFKGIKPSEIGYSFSGGKKHTGNENAIIWFAKRDADTGKDVPVILKVCSVQKIPTGARLHYMRTWKKHYYELYNDTKTKKLLPVVLPDKIPFSPGLFKIPAAMQTYKDAIDYSPPSLLQKAAPGVLLLAMVIVGFLMLVTGDAA